MRTKWRQPSRRWGRLVTVAAVLAAAPGLGAQSAREIRGVVRDSAGAPVPGAEIIVRAADRRAMTDSSGTFVVAGVEPGSHRVVARKVGFEPDSIAISLRESVVLELRLLPQSVRLHQVEVTAASAAVSPQLQGFERRRNGRSGGQFITRETIERRGSSRTTDFLRGVPGIQMVDSMGVTVAISSRGPKLSGTVRPGSACVLRVGVDGFLKDQMFSINLITPSDIHGIEIYAGAATIPPEFNSTGSRNAQCGLIMIWTRAR